MLPLVARSTMEVLALVPNHLREASYALGVSKWRTVLSVVLPTALGGILTGTTLAVARAAGETAPLLFTCVDLRADRRLEPDALGAVDPADHLPVLGVARPEPATTQAWAAAFVLIIFVLVTSLTARFLLDARGASSGARAERSSRRSPLRHHAVTRASAHALAGGGRLAALGKRPS